MGEALSVPGQAEGIDSDGIPKESALLAQLIQTLSQRRKHSLLLSDLEALLPANLCQRVNDQGGLRMWLQRHPTLFSISGQAGKESVTLVLDRNPEANATTEEPTTGTEGSLVDEKSGSTAGAPPSQEASPVEDIPATGTAVAAGSEQPDAAGAAGDASGADLPFDEEVDGQYSLQLRGLPYRATVEDVRSFLGEHAQHLAAEKPIHFVLNRDGRPSGFARVQFTSPEAAANCRDKLHLRGMDDRYVEVFLYSERPSRGRQRRGVLDDGTGGDTSTRRSDSLAEVHGITRDHVVLELRSQMAEPSKRRLLLSMLGVALSPAARSYLKRNDQGLKHFLAQFPKEFAVEGGKGSEYVTYTPMALSEALEDMGSTGPPNLEDLVCSVPPKAEDHLAASPTGKPAAAPSVEPTPSGTGNGGIHGLKTPSVWNSPYDTTWADTAALAQNWQQPSNNMWPGSTASLPIDNTTNNAAGGVGPAAAMGNWGAASTWPAQPGAPPMWPGWWNQFPHFMGGQPPDLSALAFPGFPAPVGTGIGPTPGAQPQVGTAGVGPSAAVAAAAAIATEASATRPPPPAGVPAAAANDDPNQGAAVRLRGLPFTAREQDVLSFFSQHDVVDCIADGPKAVTLMLRSNGRPSGQAVVQMRCRADAELTLRVLHNQSMGSRYIEVFLHNGDIAAGGYNPPHQPAAASTSALQTTKGSDGAGIAMQPAGAAAAQAIPAPKVAAEMTQPSAMHTMLQTAMQGGLVPPYVPPVAAQWNSQMWGAPPTHQTAPAMGMGCGVAADGTNDAAWEALFQFLPESRAYVESQALPQGPVAAASGVPGA